MGKEGKKPFLFLYVRVSAVCDVGSAMVEEEIKGQRRGRGVKRGFMTRNSVFPSPFFRRPCFPCSLCGGSERGKDGEGNVQIRPVALPLSHIPPIAQGAEKSASCLPTNAAFSPSPFSFLSSVNLKAAGCFFGARTIG